MRLLITMLGTGNYENVTYEIQAQQYSGSCYHQIALAKTLRPDRVLIVCTEDARNKHEAALRTQLGELMSLEFIRTQIIPKCSNAEEFWQFSQIIREALDRYLGELSVGVEAQVQQPYLKLNLDLTHGFRTQPTFLLATARYSCYLHSHRMSIEDIYYSMFESKPRASTAERLPESVPQNISLLPTPILAVTPILHIEEIAAEVRSFLEHGSSMALAQRLAEAGKKLLCNLQQCIAIDFPDISGARRNRIVGEKLQELNFNKPEAVAKALNNFSAMIALNATPQAAEVTRRLCEACADLEGWPLELKPMGYALLQLRKELLAFFPTEDRPLWRWHIAIIRWCLKRDFLQQALTHANELLATRYYEEIHQNPLDHKLREKLSSLILEKSAEGHVQPQDRLPDDWKKCAKVDLGLGAYRNQVNHAFCNEDTKNVASLRRDYKSKVEELVALHESLARLPDLPALELPLEVIAIPPRTPKEIIADVKKYGLYDDKDGAIKLANLRKEWNEHGGDSPSEFDRVLTQTQTAKGYAQKAYQLASQKGLKSPEVENLIEEMQRHQLGEYLWKIKHSAKSGDLVYQRWTEERARKKKGLKNTVKARSSQPHQGGFPALTLTQTSPLPPSPEDLHPNDLRALKPDSSWTVVVDETGSVFDEDAGEASFAKKGKFVAVVIPENVEPALPRFTKKWHAVECPNPADIDNVVQQILNSSVGVLGLTLDTLPPTLGERWSMGILELMRWVCLLLPLDQRTEIKFLVEKRGDQDNSIYWDNLGRLALLEIGRYYPERSARIALKVEIISKNQFSYNGYADALAFSWAQTTAWSRQRVADSMLAGNCLWDVPCEAMNATWSSMMIGSELHPDVWEVMIGKITSHRTMGLARHLLELLGQRCQADASLWTRYLKRCHEHLESKAIHMGTLIQQISWLKKYIPNDSQLGLEEELIWGIATLATANHQGQIAENLDSYIELSKRVREENAALACEADLHLAVLFTNAFAFEQARSILLPWLDLDPRIPGLVRYGKVLSSLGQHSAFMDRHQESADYFEQAIVCFRKLQNGGQAEIGQTACYLSMVLMDDPSSSKEKLHEALRLALGEDLECAVENLAGDVSPANKYRHHLLLRYLVTEDCAKSLREAYVKLRDDWGSEEGHPWPLINFYRATLLHELQQPEAGQLALQAANQALDENSGPTIRFIGATLRTIAHHWGCTWTLECQQLTLQKLSQEITYGKKYLAHLDQVFFDQHLPLHSWLRKVLPFNFR